MSLRGDAVIVLRTVLAAIGVACAAPADAAERASNRPMRIVCPFPAGGGLDTVARVIADKLGEQLSRPAVVDNRPGASGAIGAAIVAKAAPDGNTVLFTSSSGLATAPALERVSADMILKDFSPVSLVSSTPHVLVTHPSLPVKTTLEFVRLGKTEPKRVTYASSGKGSAAHLSMELLEHLTGMQALHVPYKGSSPAVVALIGGEVQAGFANLIPVAPHVKSGKLRALGISGAARTPVMPDVPTIAESGVPGYESLQWYGMLLPAGTPNTTVQTLYKQVRTVLRMDPVREHLAKDGSVVVASTPEELASYIRAEIAKWSKVVIAANIRPD